MAPPSSASSSSSLLRFQDMTGTSHVSTLLSSAAGDSREFDVIFYLGSNQNRFFPGHQCHLSQVSSFLRSLFLSEAIGHRKRSFIPIFLPDFDESYSEALQAILDIIYTGQGLTNEADKLSDLMEALGMASNLQLEAVEPAEEEERKDEEVVDNKDEEVVDNKDEDPLLYQDTFTCCLCADVRDFNSCSDMIAHYEVHRLSPHPSDQYLCSLCETFFESISDLIHHLQSLHLTPTTATIHPYHHQQPKHAQQPKQQITSAKRRKCCVTEKSHVCPYCTYACSKLVFLRSHITSHFKDELWNQIIERQGTNFKNGCYICKKRLPPRRSNILYHFSNGHGLIRSFVDEEVYSKIFKLPEENQLIDLDEPLPQIDHSFNEETSAVFLEEPEQQQQPQQSPTIVVKPGVSSMAVCPYCDYVPSRRNKTFMKEHVISHFKAELYHDVQNGDFLGVDNQCQLCGVNLQKNGHWKNIRHFGLVHKMLRKYVQNELPDLF